MELPFPTSSGIPSRSQAAKKVIAEKELTSISPNTATPIEDDEVLYFLATQCETLFVEVGKTLKNSSAPTLQKLCAEFQQRFAIWAAQLSVFASPSQCLDTRLRKSPDLQDLTARHLDLLRRCLSHWKEAASRPPEDEDEQSGLQANLEAIDETLSRLTALGVTIRQPRADRVDERARKLTREEDAEPMRQLCTRAIRTIYPHAHEALQDRLVESMLNIWGRMKHLQSRSEKMSTRRPRPSELSSISETPDSKTLPTASRGPPNTSIAILFKGQSASSAAASELSSVDNARIMNRNKPPDQVSTNLAKTMSVRAKHGSYPQFPDKDVCKWCLQSTKGMSGTTWRRHVDRDLRPYTCLWNDCHDTKQAHATFTQWFKHMQSHEQRWYLKLYLQLEWICPLCAVDHAYHTQQALHNHLEESHSSDFPKSLFDGISRQSKVKRHRNWNECLLCSLEVKEDGGKSYGAGFKRQKSYLGSDVSKQAKTSLAMVNVGQHDSSKSNHDMNSDSNYDSDSNFNSDSDSHSKRKKDNSSRHEDRALVMGQHVWSHLQTIMLLTLRFDDLALDTGEVDGDCGNSNSVEADQIVESADSDSDKHSMSDMDVDMEEEQSGLGVDIFDDNDQNQDSTIPDCDSQPTFPMSYDNLTTDADEFMQGILESGAFQGGLSDLTHDAYTIAWFYATSCELKAALAVLDEEHQPLPRISGDSNEYVVGRIGRHNVVMTCLLQGYGEVNTAKVATDLTRSFPNIKATLVVGLGGGAPSEHVDLRLGDVVVGTAVVEYDLRKATNSRHFEAKRRPKIPAELLRAAVAVTKAQQLHHGQCSDRMMRILQTSFANTPYPHSPDRLFRPEYTHPDVVSGCVACDIAMLKPREARPSTAPWIHHGVIASGDSLIKNAAKRDDIAQRHDAICFEMEAAALMDNMQCLPIRGICDYSDSHKNKDWQNWAAATAASWARELLEVLSPFSIGHQVQSVPYNLPPPPYSQSSLAPGVFNRRKELLESLSFPKINTRRDAILQTQTCQWFLHLPKYKAWIENDRHSTSTGFLWLHGKAGAGKSTMMKFLEARARKSKLDTTVVSFFFHARGDTLQKSVEGLYRSLLYDTLKALPDLQSVLDDTATVPLTQQGCPDHDALKELLRSAIQRLGQRSLTFFIDALDECNEDDARDMVEFFRLLAEESIELRICFSSRPYPCIETEPDFVLEREAGHSEDLAKYVSENLKASKRLREDLQQQILVTAKGIFLWVVLVVKILNDEIRDGIPNPRQRLRKIPFELGDLFKEMLMRDQERPEELKLCILWVLLAKRPLNTVELRHAIWADGLESGRYEVDDDSLFEDADEQSSRIFAISTSKGLVEADDHKVARPALQFIHVSVRDFLIKERGIPQIWPELGVDWEANSHKMLMACCRAYLSHPVAGAVIDGEEAARRIISVSDDGEDDDVEQTAQDDDSNTDMKTSSDAAGCIFLGYASQHILHHANLACQSIDHEGFLAWFFSSCGYKALDYGQKFKSRRYGPTAEPLYMLADRGCARLIRASHGQYPAVYNKSLQFRHPLFAAMANNHEDTVAALLGLPNVFFEGRKLTEGLGRMADVSEFSGRTPLSWAAQEGRLSLMKILVKNGAHPKERDPGRRLPWQRAVTAGKIEAVDLLACLTVIVQLQDESLRHLMWEDVNRGDIRGAMCVLKHPDSRVARNALNEALESDWLQIMSSAGLLPAVQFVAAKSTTEQRGDALLTAAKLGHLKVVDFMLDSGAAIDFQNSPHGTAVATASSSGHADIVQFLISRKANISLEYDCETALTLSSSYGHEDVVRALVEAGADVNQQTKLGRTALMEASLRGRTSIVRLFLALGADPRLKDARNRTAYDEAVEPGEDDIAQMLRQSLEKW